MVRNLKRSPNLCDRQVFLGVFLRTKSVHHYLLPLYLRSCLTHSTGLDHLVIDSLMPPHFPCFPVYQTQAQLRSDSLRKDCVLSVTHIHIPQQPAMPAPCPSPPPHTHIVHPLLLGTVKEHTPGETVGRSADFKLSCQGSPFVKPDAKPKRQSKHKGQYTTA